MISTRLKLQIVIASAQEIPEADFEQVALMAKGEAHVLLERGEFRVVRPPVKVPGAEHLLIEVTMPALVEKSKILRPVG